MPDLGQLEAELGGEDVGQRHELGGLIRGVAEHVALVTGADLLRLQVALAHAVHRLTDVRGLLLDVNKHLAGLGVEADLWAAKWGEVARIMCPRSSTGVEIVKRCLPLARTSSEVKPISSQVLRTMAS